MHKEELIAIFYCNPAMSGFSLLVYIEIQLTLRQDLVPHKPLMEERRMVEYLSRGLSEVQKLLDKW